MTTTVKVSELPNAVTPLSGTEEVMVVQSGTSRKATAADFGVSAPVGVTDGGTGLITVTQGDLLYGSAANTYSLLSKSATASRYLANTGTANNPAWAQVTLTNGVTGTLPLGNGGTGQTTANAALNALLPSQSTHSGQFLTTDGTNTSWGAAGGSSGLTLLGTATPDTFNNFTSQQVVNFSIAGTTNAGDVVQLYLAGTFFNNVGSSRDFSCEVLLNGVQVNGGATFTIPSGDPAGVGSFIITLNATCLDTGIGNRFQCGGTLPNYSLTSCRGSDLIDATNVTLTDPMTVVVNLLWNTANAATQATVTSGFLTRMR